MLLESEIEDATDNISALSDKFADMESSYLLALEEAAGDDPVWSDEESQPSRTSDASTSGRSDWHAKVTRPGKRVFDRNVITEVVLPTLR